MHNKNETIIVRIYTAKMADATVNDVENADPEQ